MSNGSEAALGKARRLLADLGLAVDRLADALAQPENEFIRDAAIQRFEFAFELAWKAAQAVARHEGQEASSPRAAVSLAWRNGWVADEAAWLDMLEDRNRTSHTYRDALARDVFGRLPAHLLQLRALHQALSSKASA